MKRVWLIIISVILLAGVCWAADKPVSQLPATENIKNEDLFLVSQYNAGNYFSRHITFANLKKGIAVSDIYTGTINDGDLTKYDQSTGKLKSAGAAAGYTEPQSNLPICRTGAGTVGACTNLTDKTIPTYTEPASNLPLCRTGSGTWGACSNLTDAAIPATGTMTDGKWCVYSSASGIVCNSDEPSGGGGNGIDYTPPEDPTPLCSDASGAIVACTHLKMVTGDPDEVIECEGRDRTYVIGANANYFFQLPADPSGIKYCFANGAYETVISIVPDGTDVIRFIGDTTGEGDGLVSTGAYQDYVCLLGLNTSTWRVIQTMGTWAIDKVELPSEEEEPPNGNGCVTPTGTLFTESFGEGDQSCWSAGPSTCNNTWTVVSGTYAIDSSPAGAPENTACDNSMLMSRTDASQNIRADLGAGALTDVDTTINFTMYIDSTTITEWGDLSFFGVTTGSSFFDGLQYVVLLERQAPGGGAGAFAALNQTTRSWRGMAVAPNGDVYACDYPGDIYKQDGGTGDFEALGQTSRKWRGMAVAPNGDVYASVTGGDIYKQDGGTGDFEALGQTTQTWRGMAAAPNGDVYACVHGGDIYKQAGGTGDFVALGQTSRYWVGLAASPNGDVYACDYPGDIYKQDGGTGDFEALGQTSRNWRGMAAAPNGDVYACVYGGDIYKQAGGTGDFEALGQTSRNWVGMAVAPNGDVYASVSVGDIYKQSGGAATRIGVMNAAENGTCYIDNIEENTWYNVVLTVDGKGGENASSLSIGSGAGQSCSLTLPPAGRYLWFVLNNHAADIYIGNVRVSTSGGN